MYLALLLLLGHAQADPPPPSFSILDPSHFSKYLHFGTGDGSGGDTDENAWAHSNIPFFESDSEDYNIAYYFRWHMLHSHMNATGWVSKSDGTSRYIFTEFTGISSTHSGSAGHHILEARWLRDPKVVTDYGLFWALMGMGKTSYTFWGSWASFEAYKVLDPALGRDWLESIYNGLKTLYIGWIKGSHPGHGGVMIQGNGSNGKTQLTCTCGWPKVVFVKFTCEDITTLECSLLSSTALQAWLLVSPAFSRLTVTMQRRIPSAGLVVVPFRTRVPSVRLSGWVGLRPL
jgi:hypothetical protein